MELLGKFNWDTRTVVVMLMNESVATIEESESFSPDQHRPRNVPNKHFENISRKIPLRHDVCQGSAETPQTTSLDREAIVCQFEPDESGL